MSWGGARGKEMGHDVMCLTMETVRLCDVGNNVWREHRLAGCTPQNRGRFADGCLSRQRLLIKWLSGGAFIESLPEMNRALRRMAITFSTVNSYLLYIVPS